MAREPLVELMVPAFCSDEAEEPTMRRHPGAGRRTSAGP
jgi:hypothetical protein